MPNASRSFYVFLIACWLSLGLLCAGSASCNAATG